MEREWPPRESTRSCPLHRNNQDGLAVRVEPRRIVAALCDGCSAGRSSEVGARLAASWVAVHLPRILDENPVAPAEQLAGGAGRLAAAGSRRIGLRRRSAGVPAVHAAGGGDRAASAR